MLVCFAVFQYHRERQLKADELNLRLQAVNDYILRGLAENDSVFVPAGMIPVGFDDMRISIIDEDGRVVYDNTLDHLPESSHLGREEIAAAMAKGEGFAVRRHSESTGNTYFYSAKRGNGYIVRTAVPYSLSLTRLLATDYAFLWFMILVTVVMCVAGFFATRRVGRLVGRLSRFAEKAERGERIFDTEPFPHDELGDISHNIVRLYARMQQAVVDRDRQHRIALYEEQEKIRIKRQLTNNINHELKTPVASMQVCLETLMTHKDLSDEKRDEFIARCYKANDRLRRLLADVSAITRMEDGADNIIRETVDFSGLADEICGEYMDIAATKGVEIVNSIGGGLHVSGNPSLLLSIFRNLIDNALAYSGGTRIELGCRDLGNGFLSVSVADNGSGVPQEHLPRLFERFYRIDKGRSRQAGGTGLGLAIVKNAVLWHGGVIKVENRPAGGLRFNFSLPLSVC
jgi:signal transduction histidine kinase